MIIIRNRQPKPPCCPPQLKNTDNNKPPAITHSVIPIPLNQGRTINPFYPKSIQIDVG